MVPSVAVSLRGGRVDTGGDRDAFGDVVAAVGAARSAVVSRFGVGLALGAVTAVAVAVACSGARLLSPGWPTVRCSTGATPFAP